MLEQQVEIVMENYDRSFAVLVAKPDAAQDDPATDGVKRGVVLMSGYNFEMARIAYVHS